MKRKPSLLGKPDPQGYYIIVFKREILNKLKREKDVLIEETGDIVFVRTKSRRIATYLLEKYRDYTVNK
ncbi:MAG: hypothetical protein ABWW65_05265 [Thermoprotei archaeon]